jgi:hypothetical protein
MNMPTRSMRQELARWAAAAAAAAVGCALAVTGPAPLALAQSPSPNVSALDYRPSTFNTHPTGVVVEGVGMGRCSYSLSSVESATVRYIRARKPVWTEFSPQYTCARVGGYESMIRSIIHYVRSRVSLSALRWWAGLMLDEEPDFGFKPDKLIALNHYAVKQMLNVPGPALVFTEDAVFPRTWSQRKYDEIIAGTVPAPQVYNSYMVGVVNRSSPTENLVTWTNTMPFPFNHESYVTGRIHGKPYTYNFGTGHNWKWSNQWQSQ